MMAVIKQEIRRFAGARHRDGTPMYPRPFLCTYARCGGVWLLIGMEEV